MVKVNPVRNNSALSMKRLGAAFLARPNRSKISNGLKLYDTTLRDGAQSEGISFSVKDKLRIVKKLDQFGLDYLEGGWPGSNPKDIDFFRETKKLSLKKARLVAFSSTRRANVAAEKDRNLQIVLQADTPAVAIFGKSWVLHVKEVLKTSLEENLRMIYDSISFLKNNGREVIFDAEHFFDGYKENPEYALKTLERAEAAGADWLVLCDTNGGTLCQEIRKAVEAAKRMTKVSLGIHVHNDNGMAVANSLAAVEAGVTQVQGTINGYGERCGNADLCVIIPNLKLKLGIECLGDEKLKHLREISRFVNEVANLIPDEKQPYVGNSAFAHKGGTHVDAVKKTARSFEHINPDLVGNRRRILVSELSGKSNILLKARELNLDLTKETPQTQAILDRVKNLEYEGYQFEAAEASLELLLKKAMGRYRPFFSLEGFEVKVVNQAGKVISEATIKLKVKGEEEICKAFGDGPVNALDSALRKALERFFPSLKGMHLTDFKVRVLDAKAGTAAKVRVLIESADRESSWSTVGVSGNIIEASWEALIDSVEYKLIKEEETPLELPAKGGASA